MPRKRGWCATPTTSWCSPGARPRRSRRRERAESLLGERGLALHPDKTRIGCFEDGFWFLGHYFIRNLVLRDLEHAPEAAPPVWEVDVPGETDRTAPARRPPKRPVLARVSEALLKTFGRRHGDVAGGAADAR